MWLRSPSPEATRAAGRLLGGALGAEGAVISLAGALGAGKTVFAKGLAEGLGIDPAALASPTFTLIHEHRAPDGRAFAHVDCYRLRSAGELESAGFLDLLAPGAVVVIEWGDLHPEALPADRLEVRLARVPHEDSQRRLSAVASGPAAEALLARWLEALRRHAAARGELELASSGPAARSGAEESRVALVVQKYGGTSVGSPERIRNVARRVCETVRAGSQVAVVVSAMSGETDALVALAREIGGDEPDPREYDVLVATGEQKTIALLAMAIQREGLRARSFTGAQMGMRTDTAHTRARIESVNREVLLATLREGAVAVLAGFQGIDDAGNITTLGRGGSDTSAVAVAAALGADLCEIYTDVTGVFTTDPNMVPAARKLARISFDEMLEMASLGAKVLQIRSVRFAMDYGVRLHVRSSFVPDEGTWVVPEEEVMERLVVSGVTYNRNEAKIRVRGVKDVPGVAARLFTPLSDQGIVVDMIIQNLSQDGTTDLTFTVPRGEYKRSLAIAQGTAAELGATVEGDTAIAKVSIVGLGMKDHAGVASRMFQVLADQGVNIQLISTSEIKVSVVIEERYTEQAVSALHAAFVEAGAAAPRPER